MAYDQLEPIGSQADRRQLATLLSIVAEPLRVASVHPRPFDADDFMPGLIAAPRTPSPADVVAKGRAIFGAIAAAQQKGKAN